jgi:hypothetical protein
MEGRRAAMATKHRRTIKVTRRQVETAQTALRTDRILGRPTDRAVEMIANARPVVVDGPDQRAARSAAG